MFLLRNAHPVAPELPTITEYELHKDAKAASKPAATLEGLIAEDPFPSEDVDKDSDIYSGAAGSASQDHTQIGNLDVVDDEGWITIPKGEQLLILVCLSAAKQDEEIITPFKVAEVMSKTGSSTKNSKHKEDISGMDSSVSGQVDANGKLDRDAGLGEGYGEALSTVEKMDPEQNITVTKSLLQKEGHKQQIETLLERFRHSNFFVRIAQSDEPLWSKRFLAESCSVNSEMEGGLSHSNDVT